jgi:hypothetical protein
MGPVISGNFLEAGMEATNVVKYFRGLLIYLKFEL